MASEKLELGWPCASCAFHVWVRFTWVRIHRIFVNDLLDHASNEIRGSIALGLGDLERRAWTKVSRMGRVVG